MEKYLISLYFDDDTNKKISGIMKSISRKSGNTYMQEKNIPPHLTVAMAEGKQDTLMEVIGDVRNTLARGNIKIVSVGCFKPHVIYLSVLNDQYLHSISLSINEKLEEKHLQNKESIYKPFFWMPHITLARRLTQEQLLEAFGVTISNFEPFEGMVVGLGIAKCNPHTDIRFWQL